MSKHSVEELLQIRDSGPLALDEETLDVDDRKLLSDLRLLCLLAANNQDKPTSPGSFDDESIIHFLNENLPHDQMVEIEKQLKSNPEEFEAFLNLKIESVISQLPEMPSDLSRSALAAFKAPLEKATGQQVNRAESPSSTKNIFSWLSESFGNKLPAFIGAGAVTGIAVFIIASIFLINDSPPLNPILVADLGFDYKQESMTVITRGEEDLTKNKPKVTVLAAGDFDLSSKMREILINLDGEPRKETQAELFAYLKIQQNLDQLSYYIQIDKQVWSAVEDESKNIAYGEWALNDNTGRLSRFGPQLVKFPR